MKNNLPFLLIISTAFLLRLPHITSPVLDWHSFRQADTASVTYEYVRNGVDLLHPKFHDFSNIASGKDNLAGYRMVEFPWINGLLASILRFAPNLSLVVLSRGFTIALSLVTLSSLYFFVKLFSDKKTALLAAMTFAVLPYAVFYSRVILPDPVMIALATASVTLFAYWLHSRHWRYYAASFLLLALAALTKPFVLFLAPVYVSLLFVQFLKKKLVWQQVFWTMMLPSSLLPLWWWRDWILQFPSGIPASDWLYNGPINEVPPRLRPVWFRWLWYERLSKLILGYTGTVLLIPLLLRWKKISTPELFVYGSWWLSVLLFFVVIARGNIQHDYYQVFTLPIICISVAKGVRLLFAWLQHKLHKKIAITLTVALYLSMLLLSLQQVVGYYQINHWEYYRVGQRAQAVLPEEAIVVAPAFGDTSFLFQTRRRGWPIGFEIEKKVAAGAQYYITTTYDDEAKTLESTYELIEKTPEYLILNLQNTL
ncbi:MAG: phospholipid carrier-dependent glycosyltransferase [Candidatus Pacebacteria bacterium]|nr:phospholipid carrier-dependent glycosyltransferase [Candidatus Paceibacterota bacterium]PIR60684.1 MAG: hypothetical protein COU67_00980 [Candidatus Pacebacteria bacterium CG10_big_fil_rev_8_21_14_0_10_44_54]